MRIIWDHQFKQFEAQLTAGSSWATEQQTVKAAGFLTEGPPEWKWLSFRAGVLTKLKAASLASGLSITITPAAWTQYQRLKEQENTNAAVKAELKAAKKEQKTEDPGSNFKMVMGPEGFLIAEVEPRESKIWSQFVPPPMPATLCYVCQMPIWSYECQQPPTCLDCEFDPGL